MKNALTIPEDLTQVSDEDLVKLTEDIREAAEDLAADAAKDDTALAEIEKLASEFDKIGAEQVARKDAEAARGERVSSALNKFNGTDAPAEEAPEEPAAEVEEPLAAAEEEPVEAASAEVEEPEAPAAPAPVEAAAAVEAPVEAAVEAPEAPAAEAPAPVEVTAQEDAVSAASTIAPTSTAVASLDDARPEALSVEAAAPVAVGAPLLASNAFPGRHEDEPVTTSELAAAIAGKAHNGTYVSAGTSERLTLGTARFSTGNKVGGSEFENFSVIDRVVREHSARTTEDTALVASGGNCAPLQQSYEFFRLAEPINPVEGSLPVVDAPRAGIRFITPPDFRDAAGGVRVTTEAQDRAGYEGQDLPSPATNDTAPKPCVRVICPPVEECRVDAISQCVTFGNLNYRVFPEQVDAFLADLAVIFTQTKEVFYLDAIDAASTKVTVSPDYSAVRGLTYVLLAAAANYRRRHHMPTEAVLSLYLPSWVVEFIKVDLINDHSLGLNFLGAGQAEVSSVFATMNLDITWYYDSATGAGQAFDAAQGEGVLNSFPANVVAYLFAPGTFVRLNGGTLEVGLVRDSVLNGTNDLQLFSEEWIQVCMVGLESIRLEIALCPDGTAPEPVVPLECVGGSI